MNSSIWPSSNSKDESEKRIEQLNEESVVQVWMLKLSKIFRSPRHFPKTPSVGLSNNPARLSESPKSSAVREYLALQTGDRGLSQIDG